MTAASPSDYVDIFLEHALDGDAHEAVALTLGLLDAGVPGEVVIADLLVPAQCRVGERWHKNELSIADEHLVAGAAESALHALARAHAPRAHKGSIVVACAEGEWHSIAGHMIAEQLRGRGFGVTFLGASTPAGDVENFLERHRAHALAVSCSLASSFAGVARLSDAAHRHAVPVLAGGHGLGSTAGRARRLGADGWARDVSEAEALLASWRRQPPTIVAIPVALDHDAIELTARAGELARVAFDHLLADSPAVARRGAQPLDPFRENLELAVRFVGAAQLVEDEAVFTDFLDWLVELLAVRAIARPLVVEGFEALAPLLADASPAAGHLAELGLRHLRSTVRSSGSSRPDASSPRFAH